MIEPRDEEWPDPGTEVEGHVDVSVIIVNWNTRQLLLDVIDSLRETTRATTLEIVVVDNASHDGSVEAVERLHPEVRVIVNPENYGFARANNIGFRVARGDAYCLVNTDVIALDGVIDTMWAYLRSHPGVGAVGPKTVDGHGALRRNVRRFPSLRSSLGDDLHLKHVMPGLLPGRSLPRASFDIAHSAEVLSGCFLMVRREAVADVGPLDEGFFFYGEDTDWAKRFHDAGWDCVYLPEARAVHLGGGSTAAYPVRYYLAMEQADLRYWNKHHPPLACAAYVAIRLVHHLVSVFWWGARWLGHPDQRDDTSLKVRGNVTNTAWLLLRRPRAGPH